MSFAGHAAAMIKNIQNNRSLAANSTSYFKQKEKYQTGSYDDKKSLSTFNFKQRTKEEYMAMQKKVKQQIRKEQMITVVISLILFFIILFLFYYVI